MIRRVATMLPLLLMALGIVPAWAGTAGTLTITEDTKLRSDHLGNIVVAADGITLDCLGHTVSGVDETGIMVQDHRSVTIRDCRVTGFFNGIVLLGGTGNRLIDNTTSANLNAGVACAEAQDNLVKGNAADDNGNNGFQFSFCSGNAVRDNSATGNHGTGGFAFASSNDNRMLGNVADANGDAGFHLIGSSGNRLAFNHARGNTVRGFGLFLASDGNTVVGNAASENLGDGFELGGSNRNTVKRNASWDNARGFEIYDAEQNRFIENTATSNDLNGFILFATSHTTFAHNRSTSNGGNGFIQWGSLGEAFPSSTLNTFSRNVAADNALNGFALHGAADSPIGDDPPTRGTYRHNAAFANAGIGFYLSTDTGPTVENVLEVNVACKNREGDALDENAPGDNVWRGNRLCTPLAVTIVNTLGTASPDGTFDVFGSGGQGISDGGFVGPRFTLAERTVVTEIGGFLNNCETIIAGIPQCPDTQPFTVQIRPSVGGAPDPSKVLATLVLSHDDDPLVVSFESVEDHLILPPGSYFALFAPQGEDGGFLMGFASAPSAYQAGTTPMGFLDPSSGQALASDSIAAVRILGRTTRSS